MHIALLTDGIYPYIMGGMQKHSYSLARYLAQKEIYVDVYHPTPSIPKANVFSEDETHFVRLIEVPVPRKHHFPGHYIYESYMYSKALFQQFKASKIQPDLVYIQGFSGWYWLTRRKQRDPITVINFHGLNMFQKAANIKSKIEHLMFRPFVRWNISHADYSISLGGKLTSILEKLTKDILELPIGIENKWLFSKNHQLSEKTIRKFVFTGRYERLKGIQELQEVILKLPLSTKFQFEFIGPIPKNKQLKHPNVKYWGALYDENIIIQILQQADVLVCPSWSEGMPIVILEAMASGCAIIATDVGAVAELVSGENGWLLPQVTLSGLKAALLDAMQCNTETLLLKKQCSLEKIKAHFLWEKVIQLHIEKFNLVKELAQQ